VNPPNLKELFGERYRITYDDAEEGRNNAWMMQIPCLGKGITIYPHGHGLLAVELNRRPVLAGRLRRLGLTMHQSGDREKTLLLPLERFPKVFFSFVVVVKRYDARQRLALKH